MSIEKILLKHGVNLIKDKAIDTANKSISSFQHGLNKEVGNIVNSIKNMPQDLYKQSIRNFHVESHRATFQHNPNQSTYDYFESYYSNQNKRYSPTPTPNLAQQLYEHEINLNKHRFR